MEKLNYYDSDINMIWQSSPEESGEALKSFQELQHLIVMNTKKLMMK